MHSVGADRIRPQPYGIELLDEWNRCPVTALGFPEGVAERSESFKMMIAGGNHSEIKKLSRQIIGTSEPIIYRD